MLQIRKISCSALLAGACALAILVPPAGAQAKERVLYSFASGSDGAVPFAGLITDANGNFYGTTAYGGAGGHGTIFSLSRRGSETVLYTFAGYPGDGANPQGNLVRDKTGNLYGTTAGGGAGGAGTVFKLQQGGTETMLYAFTGGSDGANPEAGLVMDPVGNLFGTTYGGGAHGSGTVFKIATNGSETVLHSFGAQNDGSSPRAGLMEDAKGTFYGATVFGGAYGYGTIFRLTAGGAETVLYSFTGGSDGANPVGRLVGDKSRNLYGTTSAAGAGGGGTVFRLSRSGTETVLHSFAGGSDGAQPLAGLVMDKTGDLYGTTFAGGSVSKGTVFKLSPDGTETVLHAFTGGNDGSEPLGDPTQNRHGHLYGTTSIGGASGDGTVFEVGR